FKRTDSLGFFYLATAEMSLVDFCTAIENVNKVTGIFSNVLLLHLISKYSRPSLGTYKYLLIVFACSDVMLTTVHASINHQVVSVGTTFASVAYTFAESRCLTAIYCSSFTFAFSMNVFNFLYRYWAVKQQVMVDSRNTSILLQSVPRPIFHKQIFHLTAHLRFWIDWRDG
ncbi:hypothetical protein PENTCL1PPCAC_13538, partial [Pristionchus entomophagus]